MRKTTFATHFRLHSFPYKSLYPCLYELKGDLSPVMLKEIFHDSFENFEITRICRGPARGGSHVARLNFKTSRFSVY